MTTMQTGNYEVSTAAERMRRYRERKRQGVVCVGTFGTLDAAAAEALQRFGRGPYLIRQVTIAPLITTADVNALQIGAKI